jgi:hypothetical protein
LRRGAALVEHGAMPGNPKNLRRGGGRQKGVPNRATVVVREWARAIFEDPEVRAVLHAKAATGELAPGIVTELLHYAYGRPREVVELDAPCHLPDPRTLTTAELEDAILKHAEDIAAERARAVGGSPTDPRLTELERPRTTNPRCRHRYSHENFGCGDSEVRPRGLPPPGTFCSPRVATPPPRRYAKNALR